MTFLLPPGIKGLSLALTGFWNYYDNRSFYQISCITIIVIFFQWDILTKQFNAIALLKFRKKNLIFLSKGSLVFSASWELFLTKKIQDQKNMSQISLKERTTHLGSCTFLQEMLINIKIRHFHSSINHQ